MQPPQNFSRDSGLYWVNVTSVGMPPPENTGMAMGCGEKGWFAESALHNKDRIRTPPDPVVLEENSLPCRMASANRGFLMNLIYTPEI